MKKQTLKKYITSLSKALDSEKALEALKTLSDELSKYIEPESHVDVAQLKIPSEYSRMENLYVLYTDGACRGNPGPGSWAYIIQNNESSIVEENADFDEYTTNNKMELGAVINGLESLASMVTPMHTILVYTDSKYVVDGMKSWVTGWKRRGWKKADNKAPENVELWKKLDELRSIANIDFHWVKGHSGHAQNEYVDGLANKVLDENGF